MSVTSSHLEAAWQVVLSVQSVVDRAQSSVSFDLLEQLDLAIGQLAQHATTTPRGTTPQLEQARQVMRHACELSQLPPISWSLLQLARENQEKLDYNQAVNLLNKIIELSGRETPAFIKKLLSEVYLARVQQLFESFKINENTLAKLKPKEALANYSQFHWAHDDLLAAKKLAPHNPAIEAKLSALKIMLTRLEPIARENYIRVMPRPGTPERLLPVFLKVEAPTFDLKKYMIASLALLLTGGGVATYVTLYGVPELFVAWQRDPPPTPPPTKPVSDGGHKPASTTGVDNELGMAIPPPRDGLTVQEALQKVEKMGVKVPTGEGQPPTAPAKTPTAVDQEAGPVVPAPRDGLTVQEAPQQVEKVGVKAPTSDTPPVDAPVDGTPPQQESTPKAETTDVQAPASQASDPVVMGQAVPPPTDGAQESLPQTPEQPPPVQEGPEEAVTTEAPPSLSSLPHETYKLQLQTIKPGDAVSITLVSGRKSQGFWGEVDATLGITILPIGTRPPGTVIKPIPQQEIAAIQQIPELSLYLKQRVKVIRSSGVSQTGTLTAFDQESVFLEQRSKFGIMKLTVPRKSIEKIKLLEVR